MLTSGPYRFQLTQTPGAQINTPFVTSLVSVNQSPPIATTPETTTVKDNALNAGQFNMPFVLTITRK